MERNDTAVKEILTQISKDDAASALEEVRSIVHRHLQVNRERNASNDNTLSHHVKNDAHVTNHFRNNIMNNASDLERQSSSTTETTELAFTISKDSEEYHSIMSMVKWHRDSFLSGPDYASLRNSDSANFNPNIHGKNDLAKNTSIDTNVSYSEMENQHTSLKSSDFTGFVYPPLLSAVENYTSSNNTIDFLRQSSMQFLSKDQAVVQTASQSLASTIPLFQTLTDDVIKNNVLWVLKDKGWKDYTKNILARYVNRSYKDKDS